MEFVRVWLYVESQRVILNSQTGVNHIASVLLAKFKI
jgi:hypothetical protein